MLKCIAVLITISLIFTGASWLVWENLLWFKENIAVFQVLLVLMIIIILARFAVSLDECLDNKEK